MVNQAVYQMNMFLIAVNKMRDKLKHLSNDVIFNMDETALFYNFAPTSNYMQKF